MWCNERWLNKIFPFQVWSFEVFAALVFFLFFSSVVTTSDSPYYMPCQDKSTIQLKSSVLSFDVWRILSPGGPIFISVSSDVFRLVSLCVFSQLTVIPTSSATLSLLKMAAQSATKLWRVLTCDRTRGKNSAKKQSSSWLVPVPRDHLGVFKLLARDPEKKNNQFKQQSVVD